MHGSRACFFADKYCFELGGRANALEGQDVPRRAGAAGARRGAGEHLSAPRPEGGGALHRELRRAASGLAAGEFEIAQAAVDNAVAMVELAKQDVVIVTGGDSSMNELIVQPEVRSYGDLKGHTLLVDALNTAYALQLKKILLMNGLKDGVDYKLNPIGGTTQRLR